MHAVGLMQAGRELGFGRRVFVWEGRGSWAVGFDGESRILDRIFVRRVLWEIYGVFGRGED